MHLDPSAAQLFASGLQQFTQPVTGFDRVNGSGYLARRRSFRPALQRLATFLCITTKHFIITDSRFPMADWNAGGADGKSSITSRNSSSSTESPLKFGHNGINTISGYVDQSHNRC